MIYRSVFFFFLNIFLIWTICKVFIEFSKILLRFNLLVCHEACGILAPQPIIGPVPHALEDDVLVAYQRSPYRSLLIILSFFFSGSLLFHSYPGCSQLLINAYTFEVLLSFKEKRPLKEIDDLMDSFAEPHIRGDGPRLKGLNWMPGQVEKVTSPAVTGPRRHPGMLFCVPGALRGTVFLILSFFLSQMLWLIYLGY